MASCLSPLPPLTHLDVTSWSLIKRAAAGNPADRDAFAARYQQVVGAFFCARWKLPLDHYEVQDAAQEVFLECFKENGVLQRADPESGNAFRAFLYGVARRVAARVEHRISSRREQDADTAIRLEAIENSEVTLSRAFDRAWARLVTTEAGKLAFAREKDRPVRRQGLLALQLRFAKGLPPREIAKRLDMDVATVYERLRGAKKDFRAAFLEVMAAYNPDATEAELVKRCRELAAQL